MPRKLKYVIALFCIGMTLDAIGLIIRIASGERASVAFAVALFIATTIFLIREFVTQSATAWLVARIYSLVCIVYTILFLLWLSVARSWASFVPIGTHLFAPISHAIIGLAYFPLGHQITRQYFGILPRTAKEIDL